MPDFTVVFAVTADTMADVEADIQTWTVTEGTQLVSIQGMVTSDLAPATAGAEGTLVRASDAAD